jgi:flavodoxin
MALRTTMITRRKTVAGIFAAGIGGSIAVGSRTGDAQPIAARNRTLVAYFTRTGNTKLIATKVRRDVGADLLEIQPARSYPEDYEATVAQAERERLAEFEPPLRESAAKIGAYGTIYLGFPIWGSTAPTVIKSFLAKHDLSGKDLVPLITHGGYGAGDSLVVLRRMAPKARVYKPFVIRMDQERAILKEFVDWMQSSDAPR